MTTDDGHPAPACALLCILIVSQQKDERYLNIFTKGVLFCDAHKICTRISARHEKNKLIHKIIEFRVQIICAIVDFEQEGRLHKRISTTVKEET